MRIKKFAKTVVLDASGQVLLIKRSMSDERKAGEWDFPGGGVESHEDFTRGAARELQEEAGIKLPLKAFRLLYVATEYYAPRRESNSRALFAVKLRADNQQAIVLSFEHEDFKWVSLEQALIDFPHPFYAKGLRFAIKHKLLA